MENIKNLVLNDLKEHNETERLKRVKENSKLKKVTIYYNKSKFNEKFIEDSKNEGIKTIEKDLSLYNEIRTIVQMRTNLVIEINKNYIVQGRDFSDVKQCVSILKHYADPDFVNPSYEDQVLQSLKNIQWNLSRGLSNLSKQVMPVVKILNELAKEDE